MKYKIDWVDYSKEAFGKPRKYTASATSLDKALSAFYKKYPKGKMPSVSCVATQAKEAKP